MEYEFNINKKYLTSIYQNTKRYIVIGGGAGAGKSYFIAQYFIIMALAANEAKYLILRKIRKTVKLSTLALFEEILKKINIPYKINLTDLVITIRSSQLIFGGLDDSEKIKSIQGINKIFLEEATEFTKQDIEQLDLRLRGEQRDNSYLYSYQLFFSFNPDIQKGLFLKNRFYDRQDKDALSLLVNYEYNKFIDKKYIDKLNSIEDNALKSIYCDGVWAELENRVYSNFTIIENVPIINNFYGGVDFGFNDPNVFLLIGIYDNDIYIIDEIYQSGIYIEKFIDIIKEKLNLYNIDYKRLEITADSNNPAYIQKMIEAKMNARAANKKPGSVYSGIMKIKNKKIYINSICNNFIKEIQAYSWKEKNEQVLDEPVKFFDHAMDAMRYGLEPFLNYGNLSIEIDTAGEYISV